MESVVLLQGTIGREPASHGPARDARVDLRRLLLISDDRHFELRQGGKRGGAAPRKRASGEHTYHSEQSYAAGSRCRFLAMLPKHWEFRVHRPRECQDSSGWLR